MTGKRRIRRTVRGSLCGYVGRSLWANFGDAFDPAAERRAAAWLAGEDQGHIADKMQEFIPGMVEGQLEFFHAAEDGAVTRWWIVPGSYGPTIHGPAADHPLGRNPVPGWYWRGGAPVGCDPRELDP